MKCWPFAFFPCLCASSAVAQSCFDRTTEFKSTLALNQTDGNGCNEGDLLSSVAVASAAETTPFPKMPEKIRALLHEDWDTLDPRGAGMIAALSDIDAAVEFAHARTTFYEHLKGTFGILSAWSQPADVRRAGLMHTAYSGSDFQFYLFDSNDDEDRGRVRDILGTETAEALTYLFGTVDRSSLCSFADVVNREIRNAVCPPGNQTVMQRGPSFYGASNPIDIGAQDAANILMVTIADYMEQFVDINLWRDHHQANNGGMKLYPGSGRPAIGFYWFSSVCNAIRDYLEVIPTVFNHCQDVVYVEEEEEARDLYWKVTTNEESLSEEEQIELLNTSVRLNDFIAEPHVLLAQIYFRQERYESAAREANAALVKFYALATNWDKRRSFNHWVGFARALLLRANRMIEGSRKGCSFPCHDPTNPLYTNHRNMKLTNLGDVVKQMKEREE